MAGTDVAIVDSGGANIASLRFALRRLGASGELTRDPDRIAGASRVILPGVGAAADAMQRLRESKLIEMLGRLEQPVLGICLGMQLLARASEEDETPCLAIVPALARKLPASAEHPVPNMGWCRVSGFGAHALFEGIDDGSFFYFLHSYALPVGDYTVATAMHAAPFTAVLAHRNFFAAQFHPERSAGAGSRFLANFLGLPS